MGVGDADEPKKTENLPPDAECTFSRSMDRLASQPQSHEQHTCSDEHFQNKTINARHFNYPFFMCKYGSI